jgi:hypothetical protein
MRASMAVPETLYRYTKSYACDSVVRWCQKFAVAFVQWNVRGHVASNMENGQILEIPRVREIDALEYVRIVFLSARLLGSSSFLGHLLLPVT